MQFMSRFRNHTLVMKPVRKKEVNGEIVYTDGERVRFKNHSFSTDDKDLIEALRAHKMFNIDFYETPDQEAKEKIVKEITEEEKEEAVKEIKTKKKSSKQKSKESF